MVEKNVLASVDLGSNSFRLLIARVRNDGTLRPIDQLKTTVRLASGLDENNYLNKDVQKIALEALARFNERLAGFSQSQVRVVGTSSLRVARNSEEFISEANKVLGFPIEVISGNEEARLVYMGAVHSLAYSEENRLVIDIGGGSTEFIIGCGHNPQIMESVTMGCVSYSNKYFPHGELTADNFTNAIFAARSKIQTMEHFFAKHNWSEAIGTSGSARALYDICVANGFSDLISRDGLEQLKHLLIKNKNIKNIAINGLKEDRHPVIAGGVSIMLAIFEELNIDTMTIADGSLREGVMYDMLGRKEKRDLRHITVEDLMQRYSMDILQSLRVANLTRFIFSGLVPVIVTDENRVKLLYWAASLYEIGLSISHNDYHKHGSYILANSDLAGFSKPEQLIIAELVRGHRGQLTRVFDRIRKTYKQRLKSKVIFGILALRLSVIFNRNRKDIAYEQFTEVNALGRQVVELVIQKEWLQQNPLTHYSLMEEINQWQECGYIINLIEK